MKMVELTTTKETVCKFISAAMFRINGSYTADVDWQAVYEHVEFLSILEKQEIPYVVLRGTAAAMYYPNPMLREMGGVDVYVPYRYHAELIVN